MTEKGSSDTQYIVKNIYQDQGGKIDTVAAKKKLLALIRNAMISEANSLGRIQI